MLFEIYSIYHLSKTFCNKIASNPRLVNCSNNTTDFSVTTTSLYGKAKTGGLSQYDRLKHWKKMGYSQGSLSYELTKETEKE